MASTGADTPGTTFPRARGQASGHSCCAQVQSPTSARLFTYRFGDNAGVGVNHRSHAQLRWARGKAFARSRLATSQDSAWVTRIGNNLASEIEEDLVVRMAQMAIVSKSSG